MSKRASPFPSLLSVTFIPIFCHIAITLLKTPPNSTDLSLSAMTPILWPSFSTTSFNVASHVMIPPVPLVLCSHLSPILTGRDGRTLSADITCPPSRSATSFACSSVRPASFNIFAIFPKPFSSLISPFGAILNVNSESSTALKIFSVVSFRPLLSPFSESNDCLPIIVSALCTIFRTCIFIDALPSSPTSVVSTLSTCSLLCVAAMPPWSVSTAPFNL